MNGAEQKERRTAIDRLERLIDVSLIELREAWKVELDARLKGEQRTREMFAKMLSDETEFRQRALRVTNNKVDVSVGMLGGFIKLPWYSRWAWMLGGEWALTQIAKRHKRPEPAPAEPTVSDIDTYKKARAGSERPQ